MTPTYSYDPTPRPTLRKPLGQITNFSYDPYGQRPRPRVVDTPGNRTTFTYSVRAAEPLRPAVPPDLLVATCTRLQAEYLAEFDHHRVRVRGNCGVLLMYHLTPLRFAREPLEAHVVFGRTAVCPDASTEVQSVINLLNFHLPAVRAR